MSGRIRSGKDHRPFHVYARCPTTGLLMHDGLVYRGKRCAEREARKITRTLGSEAEVRPITA